jgi:hypothetical protein
LGIAHKWLFLPAEGNYFRKRAQRRADKARNPWLNNIDVEGSGTAPAMMGVFGDAS